MTKHAEELTKLGWQYFECPACGSEGAKAFPKPEQEPVAWMCADESLINKGYARFSHVCMGDWKIPVYTTPPQRKPLTDEEIQDIVNDASLAGTLSWTGYKEDDEGKYTIPVLSPSDYQFARAIEAAHGIKGEA